MSVVRQRRPRPLFSSFAGWTKDGIGRDILAGLTLTAITIPEQMATAKLGGFEPQIGFYAFIGATIGFVVLGASRFLTAGADSTITPIFAGTLAALTGGGGLTSVGSVATTLALLVGAMLVAGGALKLGWVANLLSTPVITGFLAGIAVHIIVSQLPSLFGVAKGAGNLGDQVLLIAANLSRLNPFSTAIGLGVLATMILAERTSAHIPGALIGVALAAIVVLVFQLENRGVAVIGALPGGLPRLALPTFDFLRQLIPLALIITLVIMMQTATVTYSFRNSADQPDVDRDFLGLGAGNLVAAFLGAFPVNASPPRTAIVVESGSMSQFSALVAAAIVLALGFWGGALLYHVPEAALAGVLLFVAQRIVRVGTIVKVARQAPVEGLLILLTAAAIIILPIETGVAIGIGLSLAHGVSTAIRTHPIELRKLPGTTVWWPPELAGQGETQEGVAVLAFQAPLLFANAQIFKRDMIEAIDGYDRPLSLIVLEASGIADIDFTAAQALLDIIDHCRAADISFALARLESARAHAAITRFGVLTALGPDHLFHSVDDAVNRLARG